MRQIDETAYISCKRTIVQVKYKALIRAVCQAYTVSFMAPAFCDTEHGASASSTGPFVQVKEEPTAAFQCRAVTFATGNDLPAPIIERHTLRMPPLEQVGFP